MGLNSKSSTGGSGGGAIVPISLNFNPSLKNSINSVCEIVPSLSASNTTKSSSGKSVNINPKSIILRLNTDNVSFSLQSINFNSKFFADKFNLFASFTILSRNFSFLS